MGKIWVQTPSGKIIHLPIVEDDVNTPDDTIKIPTGVFISDRHPPSMCAWLGLAFTMNRIKERKCPVEYLSQQ